MSFFNGNIKFEALIKEFDGSLQNENRFYKSYMTLSEELFLFIRASREQNWQPHFYNLHLLCPYITNYARMSLVYLLQIYELREKDIATWELFEQELFSLSNSDEPFTVNECDHGIEQESGALKKLGGIEDTANSDRGLEEYFLTAG